jgi:pimeloyl-ACP methyl ester carboxylesterase
MSLSGAAAANLDPSAPAAGSTRVASAIVPGGSGWWACGDAADAVECAWLEVPLDYQDPASASIRLLAKRLPASQPASQAGVLVTIAGGPGQRGTDGVFTGAHSAAIHEAFDIVSWDPRGTSGETLIDCIPEWDPYAGLDRTPDTADERRALDEATASLAKACRDAHSAQLPFVGTLEAALDLEQLRQMLGASQISILGSSYGSGVAVLYATLFPGRVRGVVVDGYSDPNAPPGEREIEQAAAFEHQLDELLVECALQPACALHDGGEPGETLDRLLASLDREPLAADEGRWVTQSDAYEAIAGHLVRDGRARHELLDALASADRGSGEPLLRMAEGVRHTYEASGLNQGTFMAVHCADTADYWRGLSSEALARFVARLHVAAPRLGPWLWSPPSSADLPPVGLCAMLPDRPARASGPVDAAGAGPILVLATTGDPTTPLSAARRAVADLEEAVLLVLDEEQHLSYPFAVSDPDRPAYRCLLDAVEAYLIEEQAPVAGAVCVD